MAYSINEVALHWSRLVSGWVTIFMAQYVTIQSGQLSPAIPFWVSAVYC